jgi:hypothetical protein
MSKRYQQGTTVREIERSGRAVDLTAPNSSREAAAWESPPRKCRVETGKARESRRDGTGFQVLVSPHYACSRELGQSTAFEVGIRFSAGFWSQEARNDFTALRTNLKADEYWLNLRSRSLIL